MRSLPGMFDSSESRPTNDEAFEPTSTEYGFVQPAADNDTILQPSPSPCVMVQFRNVTPWDNEESLVSAETEDLVRRLRDTVVLPILFLIGGPANVINMAVFYRQGLKERINVCLFSLALDDLCYLVNNMLIYGEQVHLQFTTKEKYGPMMRFMINHNLVGGYGFSFASEVISTIIACERCFCILQPLRSQTVMSPSTTTVIIVVVNVVVVGLYSFVTSRYRLVCAFDPATQTTTWQFGVGQFYLDNRKAVDFLDAFVFGAGVPTLAMVVVVLTTALTLVQLRQAAVWRAGTTASIPSTSSSGVLSARDVALTIMLVYNSVFFVLCVFPVVLFRLLMMTVPEMNAGGSQQNLFFTLIWLVDMTSYFNASFNFVIYYSMGSRYRDTFWAIMGRGQARAKKGVKYQTAATTSTTSTN